MIMIDSCGTLHLLQEPKDESVKLLLMGRQVRRLFHLLNQVTERSRLRNWSRKNIRNKKRRNATKTRFSTIQPSIYVTGTRNERWQ